jgi:cytochrome c-type biogenesis protein CcmH
LAPSPHSLAPFAIAGAIAVVAVAIALSRLRARHGATRAIPGTTAAPRAGALVAVFAAAAAGLLAMGIGFCAFFADAPTTSNSVPDGVGAGASRAEIARHLERSPDDGRAWVLLARIDFAANHYPDAAAAYARALAASPKVAGDPGVWCEYADALGMAQGGSLAGRPRELVMRALAQNPAHPKALEMAGSAAFEAGEYAAAVQFWRQLLPQLANDPRAQRELDGAITRAEQMTTGTDAQSGAPAAGK